MDKLTAARPRGRPSLYRSEYCDEIIEFMATGLSVKAFAGKIGVSRDTIAQWSYVHADFSEALHAGKAKACHYWERLARRAGSCSKGAGNVAIIMFALRNFGPDDWGARSTRALPGGACHGPVKVVQSRHEIERSIMAKLAERWQSGAPICLNRALKPETISISVT